MRFLFSTIFACSIFLFTPNIALDMAIAQRGDDNIRAQSISFYKQGESALHRAAYQSAVGYFETALAIDPRNRRAYIGLAQAARALDLPGKAIRHYREAITIDPTDLDAIAEQGLAFLDRGAVDQARSNLLRISDLCGQCRQLSTLAKKIDEYKNETQESAQILLPQPYFDF